MNSPSLTISARRVVLGLSGGCDSVALLLMLREKDVEVVCAHANFGLRGKESERDEAFVRHLCKEQGVPLFVRHFDTMTEAETHHESIEMAARRLRYTWFEELRISEHAEAICTAHHRDDNIETFLLNLLRGSGLVGLTGMKVGEAPLGALSDLSENVTAHILRPLLHIPRSVLEDYLRDKGQPFVTDSSNASSRYLRNRIRHELLPLLESFNPSVRNTLSDTIARLRESLYLYLQGIQAELTRLVHEEGDIKSIPVAALLNHPARLTLLHHALGNTFPTKVQAQIAELVEAPTGKHFRSGNYVCCRTRDAIEWGPTDTPLCPQGSCTLDGDRIIGQLRCRPLEKGDRFSPYGLRGTKLVSDFFTDRHVSLLRRIKARALCDDEGIVWLVGYEIDNRVATTAHTKKSITLHSRDYCKKV